VDRHDVAVHRRVARLEVEKRVIDVGRVKHAGHHGVGLCDGRNRIALADQLRGEHDAELVDGRGAFALGVVDRGNDRQRLVLDDDHVAPLLRGLGRVAEAALESERLVDRFGPVKHARSDTTLRFARPSSAAIAASRGLARSRATSARAALAGITSGGR
jgi:hypothetical protein